MQIHRILLPTDLSEEAERPFAAVSELAHRFGARIQLLHVVEDVAVGPSGDPLAPPIHIPGVAQEMKRAGAVLEQHKKKLGGGIDVSAEVISATSVPRAIASYATEHGFDLIALSTHGRSGFRRLIMGSVAETVLRHATVPVLVFTRQE